MTKKRSTTTSADEEKKEQPKRTTRRVATKARPRLRASHSPGPDAPKAKRGKAEPAKARAAAASPKPRRPATGGADLALPPRGTAPLRKAPLTGPKRTGPKRSAPPEGGVIEASSEARELAIALAAAGIEKKALGIEILDVTGKVDYADFLVIMTGRSDRHVHAIATGLEEAMRLRKSVPQSMEGLSTANWVLIDFGDVVVHVFQEEARLLYDIEGLWIDASRIPVPSDGPTPPGAGPPPLDLR